MLLEEAVKRKRGRPRKNVISVAEAPIEGIKRPRGRPKKVTQLINAPVQEETIPVKRNYITVSIEDLEFWAETTNRDFFKQVVTNYNKAKKAKANPEVRWYKNRIEII